jgi:hypothetical protein
MLGRRVSDCSSRGAGHVGRLASAALLALVVATPARALVCGDGILDVGEECDTGSLLGTGCCLLGCLTAPLGLECRPAEGSCDLPEVCDGVSPVCPTNAFKPVQVCRPAAGPCDHEETCSGVGPACPADTLEPPSTTCRPAATACDVPELCTGTSVDCPADTGEPDGDLDGVCDQEDLCPLIPDPDQADGDLDGVGDACDPCTNVAGTELEGPRMRLAKLSAPPDDDRIKIKTTFQIALDPEIDPVKKGMRLVLAGPLGTVFDAVIPPGSFDTDTRAGWKADGDFRWWYKNVSTKVPRIAGIKWITFRQHGSKPEDFRIVVSGRGGDMLAAVGQPKLRLSIVIDSPVATTGQCAEAEFITTGDDSDCRLLNGGRRLDCSQKR